MMLSCPCGHDLETWYSQNLMMSLFGNQEILIMSKFENTKNLIMMMASWSHHGDGAIITVWLCSLKYLVIKRCCYSISGHFLIIILCFLFDIFPCVILHIFLLSFSVWSCTPPPMPPDTSSNAILFFLLLGSLQHTTHLPLWEYRILGTMPLYYHTFASVRI